MPWAPPYITNDELKSYVRIHADADEFDDAEYAGKAEAASRAIDGECQRQFGNTGGPEPRYYTPRWSKTRNGWMVACDDFPTAAGLLVDLDSAHDGTFATPVTNVMTRPLNAAARGMVWEGVLILAPAGARVTGAAAEVRITPQGVGWGWPAFPETVVEATKLQASRFLARRDAPFGVAGNPEQGSELRLLAKVDPDVAVMLKQYRRRVRLR